MESLDTDPLKAPIKKSFEFFRRSRDKWKAKYFVKRDESILIANKVCAIQKSREHWRELAEVAHEKARQATSSSDVRQSLYRKVQLALQAVIGGCELDSFLTGKDDVAQELEQQVREQATVLGLEVRSVGIKDVILPSEMKDLMNRVTEAVGAFCISGEPFRSGLLL